MRKEIAMLAVVSAMYPIHNEATAPLTIVMMSKERNLLRQLTPPTAFCQHLPINLNFSIILFLLFLFVIKFVIFHTSIFIIALLQQGFDTFDFNIKVLI